MEWLRMESPDQMTDNLNAAHIATQQEKIDAVLGITGGKSIDEFLDGLSLDNDKIESTMQTIDSTVKSELSSMPDCTNNMTSIQLSSMEESLSRIEDMVELSKSVLRHVAESILATPLIDSEAVQAYSKLMESIHINIAEFVTLYKDKQSFVNKIRYAMFQQEQKKELMLMKHKLDLEKIKAKDVNSVDANVVDVNSWTQEQIIKALEKNEENDSE